MPTPLWTIPLISLFLPVEYQLDGNRSEVVARDILAGTRRPASVPQLQGANGRPRRQSRRIHGTLDHQRGRLQYKIHEASHFMGIKQQVYATYLKQERLRMTAVLYGTGFGRIDFEELLRGALPPCRHD